MCAILSDTLNLRSPTTTKTDEFMVVMLAIRAGLSSIEEVDSIALAMFKAKTEWVCSLGPQKMCRADCKVFEAAEDKQFSISVLEIAGAPDPVLAVAKEASPELARIRAEKKLQHSFLAVVDVLTQTSIVIVPSIIEESSTPGSGAATVSQAELEITLSAFGLEMEAASEGLPAGVLRIGNFASRKKQFMPLYTKAIKALG